MIVLVQADRSPYNITTSTGLVIGRPRARYNGWRLVSGFEEIFIPDENHVSSGGLFRYVRQRFPGYEPVAANAAGTKIRFRHKHAQEALQLSAQFFIQGEDLTRD